MTMHTVAAALCFFLFSYTVPNASEFIGYGCSEDRKQALEFAISDLSYQIYTEIRSETTVILTAESEKVFQYIYTESVLPLMGYTVTYNADCATVRLGGSSLALYKLKLNDTVKYINESWQYKGSDASKAGIYARLLEAYDYYGKLLMVARALGGENLPAPDKGPAELEIELRRMKDAPSDIPRIALNIVNTLKTQHFQVALVRSGAGNVTELGTLLTSEIAKHIEKSETTKVLKCSYSSNSDPMLLTCFLTDANGEVFESAYTNMDKSVCRRVDCEKPAFSVSKGIINTNLGFRGYFYSNYGSSELILKSGDILRFYVRVNSACTVALGQLDTNGNLRIIPVNRSLVTRLTPDMKNTEVPLGVFSVSPPYGVDVFTLVGYKGDLEELVTTKDGARIIKSEDLNKLRTDPSLFFEHTLTYLTQP